MAGKTLEERLADVEKKRELMIERLAQKKAAEEKKVALKLAREEKIKRADDTKRKILAGAFVLSLLDKGDVRKWLIEGLDKYLTRPEDRRVFPELPEPK